MRIECLSEKYESMFACCLEDRLPIAREAGAIRQKWIDVMKHRGLRAQLAFAGDGADTDEPPVGMIQYAPAQETLLDGGEGSYYIHCIWVTRFKDDRGNHQGQGMGTALLEAAEADARELGATGMSAWGLAIPIWMKASWFRKHGYAVIDKSGIARLVWKPFAPDARPPKFVHPVKKPVAEPGRVTVTSLVHGWCRAANSGHVLAKQAAEAIGAPVVYETIDTSDIAVAREWGMLDALFIDDKEISLGPPPSYKKIVGKIRAQIRKRHL